MRNTGIISNQIVSSGGGSLDISSIVHANSFRKINPSYTGKCCSVDNGVSILEIDFVNDYVDITTLQTHINAGTKADLVNLYDQFNSSNLTTTLATAFAPANKSQVVIDNGKVHITATTTQNMLSITNTISPTDSVLVVHDIGSDGKSILLGKDSATNVFAMAYEPGSSYGVGTSGINAFVNNVEYTTRGTLSSSSVNQGFKSSGSKDNVFFQHTGQWRIGRYHTLYDWSMDDGKIKEMIWFNNSNDDFDLLTQDQQDYYELT